MFSDGDVAIVSTDDRKHADKRSLATAGVEKAKEASQHATSVVSVALISTREGLGGGGRGRLLCGCGNARVRHDLVGAARDSDAACARYRRRENWQEPAVAACI